MQNKHKNDNSWEGEFQEIKSPTFEGDVDVGENDEEWILRMRKYFELHDYSSSMKDWLAVYNLNGKASKWWWYLKLSKKLT